MQSALSSAIAAARLVPRFGQQLFANVHGQARPSRVVAYSSAHQHPSIALVQGASRGLGLQFVQQLLKRDGQKVIASCRDPDSCPSLQQLHSDHKDSLDLLKLDVTDEGSIQAAADEVTGKHSHLTLLINTAGVLHIPGVLSPETALSRLDSSSLHKVFGVNAFGPILVSKAFMPLLAKGAKDGNTLRDRPSVIANLSARVGSISDNRLGGWYSYRASKTALNQLTKTMSIECTRRKMNISCIMLHPGTVDTDLSAPFQKNVVPEKLFSRERAVKQLLEIIDNTTIETNGKFFAWDKQEVPW